MDLAQYLRDLEYLVNIDSGTSDGHEGIDKIADFFEERFRALGWHTQKHSLLPNAGPTLICTNREAAQYDLLLIGHIDTVFPQGTVAEWPFSSDGEFAYGPGVADMKNGALLMYYLAREMSREVFEKLNIVMVFNSDEEIGSRFSRTVYEDYAKRSRYAFVYESASLSNGSCCAERKGGIGYTVRFHGRAGHCGFVFTNGAKSAVHEMGRWIVALSDMQDEKRGTSVNIGVASGGTKGNVVADEAKLIADIRILDNSEQKRFEDAVAALTEGAKTRGIGVDIDRRFKPAFVHSEQQNAYLSHVEELCAREGIPFSHRMRGGLSDANIIAGYGAICLDGLGPEGSDGHCTSERMRIASVDRLFRLSDTLIRDLAENK